MLRERSVWCASQKQRTQSSCLVDICVSALAVAVSCKLDDTNAPSAVEIFSS